MGRERADDSALGDPTYRLFLGARTVAVAGNALSLVALPVLVYQLTGSASATSLVLVAETAPYLVLGLPAGALADRWNRRRTMVRCGLLAGLLLATVPTAAALDALTLTHVLLVALGLGSLFVFSDAATFGVVPQMVGRRRVASATSTLVTVGTAIGLLGPVVSGVLVSLTSPALVLAVDAVAYVAAALLLSRLRWPGSEVRPDVVPRAGGTVAGLRADIGEGLRYIWAQPVIRALTLTGTGASLAGGAMTGLLVVVGVEQLGLADDSPALGWLYGAAAVGTLLASLSLPRVQRRVGVGLITSTCFGVGLMAMLLFSTVSTIGASLLLLATFNLAMTTLIVNGIVTRQVITPDRLQSRVNTTARLIAWGGTPLGAAVAGVLADQAGTGWALRIAALGLAASLVAAVALGVPRYPRLAVLTERAEAT